ncbi:Planctomycete cytochrome C [Maioricimonas rarisocia]|uniref:Planctomycete cytochrome C n=1 Tax=Maioricimonas rarisocia TaxID=2528026 RepID=A0A517Z6V1_9PLAN|nr:PSD1 and planctomycete cytochrome C domain-containing protein [Maioricimonas rarisocia]QDU38207.1 Planctomycete cytochrome C [Maioricimonas rarisocia]
MIQRALKSIVPIVGLVSAASGQIHTPSPEGTRFFESRIRPALVTHCYECHSAESGKARGGLRVDSRDALMRGGESGPAVIAKSLKESILYQALLYHDDGWQMPPKGKLPQTTIDDFRRWILMGAPDPRITSIRPAPESDLDLEAGRTFWAYQPLPETTPPPAGSTNWARTPIDRFVAAGWTDKDLHPVGDAAPQVLVRRLYFVLTGLPPSPADLQRWLPRLEVASDNVRQKVVAQLVDELLASDSYGERWGRHWLDVARYAESTGGDHNNVYQHAWRYRDYVIDAFNDDKPFDQFIREQIAGDLLPISNDSEWASNIIATGFLTIGVKSVGEEDQQRFFADLVDEQIDTMTRSFLATTVACARCHDHKFDPIPQADYYALAGIFRSTETHYGLLKAQARQATTLIDLTGMGPPAGTPDLNADEYAALIRQRDDAARALDEAMKQIRSGENVFRGLLRKLRSDRDETEAALQAYSSRGQPRVFAMGTQDRDAPLPTRLLIRGELDQPAQLVKRGVLQMLSPQDKHTLDSLTKDPGFRRHRTPGLPGLSYHSRSGRLELAEWIASPRNPLTARVITNRIWHWMFGRGLVRTVDDFGHAGETPSHPELLDYLAGRLIEQNWSIKALIHEIAMSRTWQLASTYDAHNFGIDPENRFCWRMNQRRLEAEALRDAMLAVSGQLDRQRPLGTYLRNVGEGGVGQNVFEPVIRSIDTRTRSVYLPRVRSVLPEMLELFDAPDASLVSGKRDTTSSPLQSLFLMNNRFVQDQAVALAGRLEDLPREEQITTAFELALGRSPTDRERQLASGFLVRFETDSNAIRQSSSPRGRFGSPAGRTGSRGMRRGRGRSSGPDAAPDRLPSDGSHLPPMSPLAIYCQALFGSMEFQMID